MNKAIVIDTQLLILLIVGLTNRNYIEKHKRLAPIYNDKHFDTILYLANSARKVICTAHILTETSNLLRQVAEPMCSEIMLRFRTFLGQAEENIVPSKLAAAAPDFVRLGLTDAAILSPDASHIQVLTVDHDLHVACSQAGFEVVNVLPHLFD